MKDPRKVMFDDLKLDSCKIIHTDHPVVLLCGGPVKIKERITDPAPSVKSLRHAITDKFTEFELFRPEEITSWQEDAVFKNLVDFETELAAICTLVVIILESPGSIAELGAFSQLNELKNKLLVIKPAKFNEGNNKASFINLGILRHLKETNKQSVKIFPWDINEPDKISHNTIEDSIKGIEDSLSTIKNTQVLNSDKKSHSTTIICELIRIFIALKKTEIIEYAKKFGFQLTNEQVKRKLFLLESFHLIIRIEYSGATFYCRTNQKYNRLRLAALQGKKIEDVKTTLDCHAYYEITKDRHRLGAINIHKGMKINEPK